MKKAIITCLTLILAIFINGQSIKAQSLLRKLQNKIEEEAVEAVFGEDEKKQEEQKPDDSKSSSNSPKNTKGSGLSSSSTDVLTSIDNAESAFNDKKYKDARYSIRQAILDVELEIGKKILNELPESVSGLPKIEEEDEVTSTGIGFVGLVIQRVYRKDDQELQIGVGNDSGWLSAANMYLASGAYASSSENENIKQITFQDNRAVIEYDASSGYKLSVPFGQSSIMVAEGVNFNTEKEFMDACSKINIQKIKNQLGEQ